jgi:hypothetical protein
MDFINPFMLGIVTKIYDDIVDIKLDISTNIVHILQSLIILFFTLTAYNDFYFSFPCVIVSLLNSGFDNPFWKSIIPVTIIITLYNIPYLGNNFILKILAATAAVLGILVLATFEDKLFPEEVSIEKIFFRGMLMFVFAFGAVIINSKVLPLPNFSVKPIFKLATFMFSNMIASVSIMTYLLYYSGKSLKELNGL